MSEHKHGGDIYSSPGCLDFSSNCNPLGLPDSVKEAMGRAVSMVENYPRTDHGILLEAIAEYEGVQSAQVLCGNGAAELIYAVCFASHPKKALLPVPSFAEYQSALESTDCEIQYYQMSEAFTIQRSILEYLTEDLDLLFLTNPNNPTGLLIEEVLLKEIIEKCAKQGVRLVLDECFMDFVQERDAFSMKPLLENYPNLFILKAFTKRYAMPGVRLGYGFCSDQEFLKRMKRCMQPWNISVFAYEAGLAALQEENYVEQGRNLIFLERARLMAAFTEMQVKFLDSKANYILFYGGEGLDEKLKKENILIRNCSNYTGMPSGWYRIAVRTETENNKLIEMLKKYLVEQGEN